MHFDDSFQQGYKKEEKTVMIPTDLITSVFILVVAIYATFHVYKLIQFSKIAAIGRALIFYLSIIVIDRIICTITILLSVSYPAGINNVLWCLYIVGVVLIVWEIYHYLKSIQ